MLTLQQLDTRLFARVFRQGRNSAPVYRAAKIVSRSGDGYLHLLLPAMLAGAGSTLLPQYCVLLGSAMFCERLVYWVMKNTLRRRRPQDFVPGIHSIIKASDQFSFPSGHTSAAFCLATCTGIVLGGPFAALYLWACGVALSRVLLGVHFPGDTVAGSLIGSAIAVLTAGQLGLL